MQNLKIKLREGIKLKGHEYEFFQFDNGAKVVVGESGILGHDNQLITWEELEILKDKYTKKL